jgi:hypothetical protein
MGLCMFKIITTFEHSLTLTIGEYKKSKPVHGGGSQRPNPGAG